MPITKPLKVLHVIPSLLRGGAERLCIEMVREMQAAHDVVPLIAMLHNSNGYASEYPEIRAVHADAHVTPSITGKWDVKLKAWNNLIGSFQPDVIHSHLFEAEMVSRHTLTTGVRYFSHCHQNTPQLRPFIWADLIDKSRIGELYERDFLFSKYKEANNQFICISNDTLNYHKSVLPESLKSNVHLLPNAIDVLRFTANCATPPDVAQPLRLVNIGRFDANKNQQFLIHVVKALIDSGTATELTLIGDGEQRPQLKALIKKLKLEGSVQLLGNISSIEKVLWTHHIYVHSAFSEGFGLVLIEAMASGLPVVTLDGGGNHELIEEASNGHILKTQDVELFAEKIRAVVQEANTFKRMSKSARTFAQQFDIRDYCKKLVHLYRTA